MITDIPLHSDFEKSGIAFLNLAWDSVTSLISTLEESGDAASFSDDFWEAAQTPLSTALALVQQGTEFLLKGRIAAISPFLLIVGHPNEWPRQSHKTDTSFAYFRSIDAQDLIKVHDTVTATRISDSFKERFEQLRALRNSIIHGVDKNRRIEAIQIMIEILEVSDYLVGPKKWISLRHRHLESDHSSVAYSIDHVHGQVATEIMMAVDLFEPSLTNRFFGFNKRQRRYICPNCITELGDWDDFHPNMAQLNPNSPTSTTIFCVLCQKSYGILRQPCFDKKCKGNVIDPENNMCLTCGVSE